MPLPLHGLADLRDNKRARNQFREEMPYRLADVFRTVPRGQGVPLPIPPYRPPRERKGVNLGLAVESMRYHMTDEGWQIFDGLAHAGYRLAGYQLPIDATDVAEILRRCDPDVVVVQDKREWDVVAGDFREPKARFTQIDILRSRHDIFKVTILKDAQQRNDYHRESAKEMDCHAWVIYYHPDIVTWVAPFVRKEHLIRTYHSIDRNAVPAYRPEGRHGCLLSGALSAAYPLRVWIAQNHTRLPQVTLLRHPGYHRRGCATPEFLKLLTRFRVAICTSSKYGYALRKIIEATACGCVVVTDLPVEDKLPYIDDNLVRLPPQPNLATTAAVLQKALTTYQPDRQRHFAELAKTHYDFRVLGAKLAQDIETVRQRYPQI